MLRTSSGTATSVLKESGESSSQDTRYCLSHAQSEVPADRQECLSYELQPFATCAHSSANHSNSRARCGCDRVDSGGFSTPSLNIRRGGVRATAAAFMNNPGLLRVRK